MKKNFNTFKLGELVDTHFNQYKIGSQVSLARYKGFLGRITEVKYGTKGYAYKVKWDQKPEDRWPPQDGKGFIFEFDLRCELDANNILKDLLFL